MEPAISYRPYPVAKQPPGTFLHGGSVSPLGHNEFLGDGRGKVAGARPKPNCPEETERQRSIGCSRPSHRPHPAERGA